MLHPRVTGAFRALRSYGLLAALIAMGLALAVTAPGFASVGNGADMLRDLAILGIMAAGETLVIIGGGGHTWPGREPRVKFLGKSTGNISANDLMWAFFKRHPMK